MKSIRNALWKWGDNILAAVDDYPWQMLQALVFGTVFGWAVL